MLVALAAVWVPPALQAEYVLDDKIVLVGNPSVAWPPDLARIFTAPWFPPERGFAHVVLSRPLVTLSYCLEIPLGLATPKGRHVVQLLLYALCCIGVGALIWRLLPGVYPYRVPAGVFAGIAFCALPVHAEAVMGVANRPELLSLLAVLAATFPLVAIREGTGTWRHTVLAASAFTAALFCKESALAALGAWTLWASCTREGWARLWRTLALLVAIAGAWWLWRRSVFGSVLAPTVPWLDNPLAHMDAPARIGHALRIAWFAAAHLVWPYRHWPGVSSLAPDYVFDQELFWPQRANEEFGLPGALGVVVLLSLGYVTLRLWWTSTQKNQSGRHHDAEAAILGLGCAAAFFLPVSNLLFPSTILFADRLLFAPSFGLIVAIAGGLAALRTVQRPAQWCFLGAFGAVLPLVVLPASVTVSSSWADEANLMATCRNSPRCHHNLGLAALNAGRIEQAMSHFGSASMLRGRDAETITLGLDIFRHPNARTLASGACATGDWAVFLDAPRHLQTTFPHPVKPTLSAVDWAFQCRQFAYVWNIARYVPPQKVPHPWPRRFLALAAAAGELDSGVAWARHFSPNPLHDPAWASAAVYGLEEGGYSLQAAQVLADLHRARPQMQGLDSAARDLWLKHRAGPAAVAIRAALVQAFPDLDLPPPPTIGPPASDPAAYLPLPAAASPTSP
jgi:hypothetical protein